MDQAGRPLPLSQPKFLVGFTLKLLYFHCTVICVIENYQIFFSLFDNYWIGSLGNFVFKSVPKCVGLK